MGDEQNGITETDRGQLQDATGVSIVAGAATGFDGNFFSIYNSAGVFSCYVEVEHPWRFF